MVNQFERDAKVSLQDRLQKMAGQPFSLEEAFTILDQLGQARWLLTAQSSEGISTPMLVALVAWLAVIAGCTGVFAPRHRTMFVVAILCAISVSGTIFLLMELYDPFGGVMRMSNAPLRTALEVLSQP